VHPAFVQILAQERSVRQAPDADRGIAVPGAGHQEVLLHGHVEGVDRAAVTGDRGHAIPGLRVPPEDVSHRSRAQEPAARDEKDTSWIAAPSSQTMRRPARSEEAMSPPVGMKERVLTGASCERSERTCDALWTS